MIFVGRNRELAELERTLDAAAAGRGALAVLVGEPGIGKTRLADAIAAEAAARGFRVAWGRAWESGGAPAYFPWTQVLEALGRRMPDASEATALDPDTARFQLFRSVVDQLRQESATAPLLVVLDDLHVADLSSLRMLQFVARELRALRVAIVATHRDVEARWTPDVDATLARIGREGTTLALARLPRDDVSRLVRTAALGVSARLEQAIWQATQGNPLFIEEVVRLLEADPALVESDRVPIPYGVREVIRQRLALLDDAALGVLDVAAVIGVEIHLATLVPACEASDATVIEAVVAAKRAGILAEPAPGTLRFGHALMRDAIYNDVARSRRAALHLRIADTLERSPGGAIPLTQIAHHAIAAAACDGCRIVERSLRAARALTDAHAHEDTIGLLERALAAVGPSPHDPQGAAEILLALGCARLRAGDARGGGACCVRVAERARASDDGVLFARAALAYGAEFTIGETEPTLRALLDEGLARLPAGYEALRLRIRARLAASLQPAPDPSIVAREAIEAVRAARALGDDETLLDVLHSAGAALGEVTPAPDKLPLTLEAVRLATRLGDRAKLLRAYTRLAFEQLEVGDTPGADATIDAYEAVARATGEPRHRWLVPLFRAMRAAQEGRFDDADVLIDEARELVAQMREPFARQTMTLVRMGRLRQQERGPELLALEPEALAVVARWNSSADYTHLFIASFRAMAGDRETARAHLAQVSLDSTPGRIRIARAMLAVTVVLAGDVGLAAALYDRLLPSAPLWVVYGVAGFAVEASYGRILGGLATLLGVWDDAERHFADALQRAEAIGARPEMAKIMDAHARMLLARGTPGDVDRARTFFARARVLGEAVGLTRLVDAMPAEMNAPAARRDVTAPPPGPRAFSLARDGVTWCVSFVGETFRLKDSRGLGYLARLVVEPGRELHALDLAGAGDEVDAGDGGELLDGEARAAYKRRLAELDDDLREAEGWSDGARASRARAEIELLSAELARAVGLGGRSRRSGAAAERARVAVTRRIRETVRKIAEHSPDLGRYLERSVKTGTFCSFDPM
jgi:hypothetical protein